MLGLIIKDRLQISGQIKKFSIQVRLREHNHLPSMSDLKMPQQFNDLVLPKAILRQFTDSQKPVRNTLLPELRLLVIRRFQAVGPELQVTSVREPLITARFLLQLTLTALKLVLAEHEHQVILSRLGQIIVLHRLCVPGTVDHILRPDDRMEVEVILHPRVPEEAVQAHLQAEVIILHLPVPVVVEEALLHQVAEVDVVNDHLFFKFFKQ